jgi:hypothetical protein
MPKIVVHAIVRRNHQHAPGGESRSTTGGEPQQHGKQQRSWHDRLPKLLWERKDNHGHRRERQQTGGAFDLFASRRRIAHGSGESDYDWSNSHDANGYACPPMQPGGEDLNLWAEEQPGRYGTPQR